VFSLIDFYGTGECIAFSKLYEQKQALFENDKLVFVEGRADENGDKIKLILENICSIESFQIQYAKNIVLKIEESRIGNEFIDKLKMIFEKFPGSCNVYINLLSNGSSKVYRSKEYKIEPKNELISYLKKLIGENNLSIN
jgi:DNA polymerase III alpha subunit